MHKLNYFETKWFPQLGKLGFFALTPDPLMVSVIDLIVPSDPSDFHSSYLPSCSSMRFRSFLCSVEMNFLYVRICELLFPVRAIDSPKSILKH